MKALSIIQPFATLIVIGAKRVETRSWSTDYRGRIAIHASKEFPPAYRVLCFDTPFREALLSAGIRNFRSLPCGVVLGTAELVSVGEAGRAVENLMPQELAFGDFSSGRFAWYLDDVERFKIPVEAKGALSFWEWNEAGAGR